MVKLWWLVLEVLKGIRVWIADIPAIFRWGKQDYQRRKRDSGK
jgi:hypothetical protein